MSARVRARDLPPLPGLRPRHRRVRQTLAWPGRDVGRGERLDAALPRSAEATRLTRPPYGTPAPAPDGFDWTPDLVPRPYDVTAVSVWPSEPERPVVDRVVLEHTNEPGRFVHRARRSKRVFSCLPAERLEEALTFASVVSATRWLRQHGADEPQPLTLRFRAAAAAALDQTQAAQQTEANSND